jgi:hypothetical protein
VSLSANSRLTGNSDRTAATFTQSLIGGMEAIDHEAETLLTKICDGPVLGSAMLREASWSRSNSSWGISQFKRPNDILAASSGFDQRSMTISVSSRILEIAEGLPTNRESVLTAM